jgi:hypothetical protein
LFEFRLEAGFQNDDLGTSPLKLHLGDEAVECDKIEALRKSLPFLCRRFDSLSEGLGTQLP